MSIVIVACVAISAAFLICSSRSASGGTAGLPSFESSFVSEITRGSIAAKSIRGVTFDGSQLQIGASLDGINQVQYFQLTAQGSEAIAILGYDLDVLTRFYLDGLPCFVHDATAIHRRFEKRKTPIVINPGSTLRVEYALGAVISRAYIQVALIEVARFRWTGSTAPLGGTSVASQVKAGDPPLSTLASFQVDLDVLPFDPSGSSRRIQTTLPATSGLLLYNLSYRVDSSGSGTSVGNLIRVIIDGAIVREVAPTSSDTGELFIRSPGAPIFVAPGQTLSIDFVSPVTSNTSDLLDNVNIEYALVPADRL